MDPATTNAPDGRPAAGQQLHDEGDSLQAVMHVRTNSRLMAPAVQHHTAGALRCPAWRGLALGYMAHAGGPIRSVAQKDAPDHDGMAARRGAKHDARPWDTAVLLHGEEESRG